MHSNIGLALSGLRRYDLAITHFEQSLAIDTNNVEVFCNLGNALERSNRFDEALAIYEKATLRWPNHADVNCGRGNVLARMRRLEDAIAAFCRIRSSTDIQAAHKIRARQDVFRQDAKLGLGRRAD